MVSSANCPLYFIPLVSRLFSTQMNVILRKDHIRGTHCLSTYTFTVRKFSMSPYYVQNKPYARVPLILSNVTFHQCIFTHFIFFSSPPIRTSVMVNFIYQLTKPQIAHIFGQTFFWFDQKNIWSNTFKFHRNLDINNNTSCHLQHQLQKLKIFHKSS